MIRFSQYLRMKMTLSEKVLEFMLTREGMKHEDDVNRGNTIF